MPTTLTADRLNRIEEQLSRLDERTEGIYLAVVGDGSKGSSLRERVTTLETAHTQETSWKTRGLTTGAMSVISAALAYAAHALTIAGQH